MWNQIYRTHYISFNYFFHLATKLTNQILLHVPFFSISWREAMSSRKFPRSSKEENTKSGGKYLQQGRVTLLKFLPRFLHCRRAANQLWWGGCSLHNNQTLCSQFARWGKFCFIQFFKLLNAFSLENGKRNICQVVCSPCFTNVNTFTKIYFRHCLTIQHC